MRQLQLTYVLLVAALAGCASSTSVQPTHPLIATGGTVESAKVYFLRPDIGFRGVMDLPVTISLGGKELLTLAKGQYTLVPLAPGSAEMKTESYTVAGNPGAMALVSTTRTLTFSAGETHYILFELVPRLGFRLEPGPTGGSEFVPSQISRDGALRAVRGLTPVGMAVDQPISK